MKKTIVSKIVAFAMVMCLMIGATLPAYAMEKNYVVENSSFLSSLPAYVSLGYGESKILATAVNINQTSYIHVGTIKLPNDARINRIIYKAGFQKSDHDTGVGDVKLKVQFRRNGQVIDSREFGYQATGGQTGQQIVTGVSMNQEIEVWMDSGSVNSSTANGNIRNIFLFSFEVYTD